MSTSIENMARDTNINVYSLKKEVDPKERLVEHEICNTAKAGLEAVVDFRDASSKLKKGEKDSSGLTITKPEELRGSHPIRLVHIKGARKMQMRIVCPETKSLNNHDSYVLITPSKVIVWNGRNSTVMKKAKANDFAQEIVKRREYGVVTKSPMTLEHFGKSINSSIASFLNDHKGDLREIPDIKDNDFEDAITKLNKVYEIQNNNDDFKLVLDEKMSGAFLKKNLLKTEKAFIFDFGTEIYLWLGQKYKKSSEKIEYDLVMQYVENPKPDYNDEQQKCAESYIDRGYSFVTSSSKRPEWIIVEKISEKCENILFKRKFNDWPEHELKTPIVKADDKSAKKRNKIKIEECYKDNYIQDYIVLGTVINRGCGGRDPETEFTFSIQTQSVVVYRLINMEFIKAEDAMFPFLFSADSYLIEWKFNYQRSDIKTLQGENVNTESSGREVCLYFYWQGRDCSVTEKGLSAVLTIFHVNKKAHQIHVAQDSEMPGFVSFLKDRYISGIGKLANFVKNENHLYLIRGLSEENESYLLEVDPKHDSLRARGHFIFVVPSTKTVYHWIGSLSKKGASVNNFIENVLLLFDSSSAEYKIEDINENKEPSEFKKLLGFPSIPKMLDTAMIEFCCVFKKVDQYNIECFRKVSPLFQIKSYKGRSVNYDKFQMDQHDLYFLIQPALAVVCSTQKTYLWHGWMSQKGENDEDTNKLAECNILQDKNYLDIKRAVLEDLLPFLKENTLCEEITEVHSGIEPEDFIHLFPFWKVREDIKDLQIKLGRGGDNTPTVITQEKLAEKIYYPLAVLMKRPLPEGVDPEKLEEYLDDNDFQNLFKTPRDAFSKLPKWKKLEIKKAKNLF